MVFIRLSEEDELRFIEKMSSENKFIGIKYIEGRGYCGLLRYMFTFGIVYGIDATGYSGRWCYPVDCVTECVNAFNKWDGVGDPDGPWIKYKGAPCERLNENYDKYFK